MSKNEVIAIVPEFLMNSLDRLKTTQKEVMNEQLTPQSEANQIITTELVEDQTLNHEEAPQVVEPERSSHAVSGNEEVHIPNNIRSIHCAKVRQRLGILLKELQNEKKYKNTDTIMKVESPEILPKAKPNDYNCKQQIESFQKIINQKEIEIVELVSKLDFIKNKKKASTVELRKENELLKSKNTEYKFQLDSLISKLGASEDLMKLFEDNLAAVKSIISTLTGKSEKITDEVSKIYKMMESLERKHAELDDQLSSKREIIDTLKACNDESIQENSKLQIIILGLKDEIKQEKSRFQKEFEKGKKIEMHLQSVINEKKKLRELYEDDLKIHVKTKELLKQAIEQVKSREETPTQGNPASSLIDSNMIEMEKYIEMEEQLKYNLEEKVTEVNNLKELLSRMQDETKSKIEYYLNQSKNLRDQLEEKATKNRQLEEELSVLKKQIATRDYKFLQSTSASSPPMSPQPNRSTPSQVVSARKLNHSEDKGRTNFSSLQSPYNNYNNNTTIESFEGNDVDIDFFDFDDSFNNQTISRTYYQRIPENLYDM